MDTHDEVTQNDVKENQKNNKKSLLRKIQHLLPHALTNKTDVCKHQFGCFENVVRRSLKDLLIGYCIQLLMKNIGLFVKPGKLIKSLQKVSTHLDCIRFGLFLMCFNTLYKLMLCLLRRFLSKKDSVNVAVTLR